MENEKEVVREVFIAKMKFKNIQHDLFIRSGNSPEETLNSALLQEKGHVTASTLQKQMGLSGRSSSSSYFGQSHPNSFKKNKNQHYQLSERTAFKTELTELKIQEENPTIDLTTLNKDITNHVTSAGRNYPRITNFHVQQRM